MEWGQQRGVRRGRDVVVHTHAQDGVTPCMAWDLSNWTFLASAFASPLRSGRRSDGAAGVCFRFSCLKMRVGVMWCVRRRGRAARNGLPVPCTSGRVLSSERQDTHASTLTPLRNAAWRAVDCDRGENSRASSRRGASKQCEDERNEVRRGDWWCHAPHGPEPRAARGLRGRTALPELCSVGGAPHTYMHMRDRSAWVCQCAGEHARRR